MPINTQLNKTKRYSRHTYGDDGLRGHRNIVSVSFVACDLQRPSVATAGAVMAAATVSNTAATVFTTGFTQPDIPRNLTVTIANGTAANVAAGNIVVAGTNVEGKVISENFAVTDNTPATITGNLAFKSVTSVTVPQQDGTGGTVAVNSGSKLGIGMRNIASMPIMVLTRSATGVEALEAAAASAFSSTLVESNTVTTTTTMDGAVGFRVYVLNYKWAINPVNAAPDYGV